MNDDFRWKMIGLSALLLIATLALTACASSDVQAISPDLGAPPESRIDQVCVVNTYVYMGPYIIYPISNMQVRLIENISESGEKKIYLAVSPESFTVLQERYSLLEEDLNDFSDKVTDLFGWGVWQGVSHRFIGNYFDNIIYPVSMDDDWKIFSSISDKWFELNLGNLCEDISDLFDLEVFLYASPTNSFVEQYVYLDGDVYVFYASTREGSEIFWRIAENSVNILIYSDMPLHGQVSHVVNVLDDDLGDVNIRYTLLRSDPDRDALLDLMERFVRLSADARESRVEMSHWSPQHGITVSISSGKWHHWFTGEEVVEGAIYLP